MLASVAVNVFSGSFPLLEVKHIRTRYEQFQLFGLEHLGNDLLVTDAIETSLEKLELVLTALVEDVVQVQLHVLFLVFL